MGPGGTAEKKEIFRKQDGASEKGQGAPALLQGALGRGDFRRVVRQAGLAFPENPGRRLQHNTPCPQPTGTTDHQGTGQRQSRPQPPHRLPAQLEYPGVQPEAAQFGSRGGYNTGDNTQYQEFAGLDGGQLTTTGTQ